MASNEDNDSTITSPSSPKSIYKDPDDGRQRFLLELEFVQCLDLAQNRYFEDDAFIGYLKYLQYWKRPEYAKFIMYPHCLFFLEHLQNANFRSAMAHPGNKELAHRQQFFLWKNYRSNRLKHLLSRLNPEAAAAAAAIVPPPLSAPPSTVAVTGPLTLAPPMQQAIYPGCSMAINNTSNTGADQMKIKKQV